MQKYPITFVILWIALSVCSQSTINGKVLSKNGDVLSGATVLIKGTATGTITDLDGNYYLTSDRSFPWTIVISFLGFESQEMVINSAGNQETISLTEGLVWGDEIIISASRIPEREIKTISSVTHIDEKQLDVIPINGDVNEYLRNIQGVTVVRSSTSKSNIELRGPVNVLETSTLVLKDFAPLTTSSDKILLTAASTLSPLDIKTIEVVRGPSGALYGPNVTSGVVHYLTKDAFSYTGLSGMSTVGERNLFTTRLRYAGNDGNKLGWKILANYSTSKDFPIAEEELFLADGTRLITPQNFETLGGKRWNNIDNLDDITLYNWNVEGGIEYRLSDQTKLNYTAGLIRAVTNRVIPIGHAIVGQQRFEQQLRLSSGNFFGTFYHRHIFGSIDGNGNPNALADHTFNINYGAGMEGGTQIPSPQTAERFFDLALQYRVTLNEKLNFQLGSDFKISPSYEIDYIYGASSGDNAYNIYGGYLSGKYQLNEKLTLHAVGRYDHFTAYDQNAFSPRIGMVYNPQKTTKARISFSRSYEGQSRERTYLDFNFSSILPPFFPASRIIGVAQPVTYNSPVTRFAFGDVSGGSSYNLQDIINTLATSAGVPAPSVNGSVMPTLTTAFFASPGVGFSTGVPISLDEAGLNPPTLRTVNQIEVGYSTTINQKLQLNIDLYHSWIENIQPTGEVPVTAGAQLDLVEIQNQIEQQVSPGPERDALIESLYAVPFNPTPNPGFNGTPGFGAVMSDRAQEFEYVYDIGFPTYGNQNVSYYGAELSAKYFFSSDFSIFGNYTYVSKTVWSNEDLDEKNPEYGYFLNTPPDRINVGINYYPVSGLYGSLTMNHQAQFEGRQGDGRFFTGINEARSIYDLQAGYRWETSGGTKLELGLSVNNLFDKKYSYFINMNQLSRWSSISMKVHL